MTFFQMASNFFMRNLYRTSVHPSDALRGERENWFHLQREIFGLIEFILDK